MATTSSLGVGSGLDLQTMLTKLMDAERAPIRALDTKITATNSKISLYGTLKSNLDAFRTSALTLEFSSRLSAMTATSSDTSVVGTSAAFTASAGSYAVEVTQLATAQKNVSMGYVTGTTFSGGAIDFTVAGVAAPTITLDPGSYTLQEVSTRINDAAVGVTATVINAAGGEQRLILTSNQTGAANTFSFASTLTPSAAQASLATADPTKGTTAQDATMTLDGIAVSSSSNQFTSVVTGLTFTAAKLGTSTVSVQNDNAKITAAVQSFVDSYNAVATTIKSNSSYDAATKTAQGFNGDSSARAVLDSLGTARTTVPPALSAATFKTLSELGVTIQQTGLLSLDSSQLATAVATSSTEVIKTLNAYGNTFREAVDTMQNSGGVVSARVQSMKDAIKSFQSNQTTLEYRITLIEKRYRTQFSALDGLVSQMNALSSRLSQTFTAMTKN